MASTNPMVAIMERLKEKAKARTPKKVVRNAEPSRVMVNRPKKPKRNMH